MQGRRQSDESIRLVIFQQAGQDPGKSQGTAVEGMEQLGLAGGVFEADLHAIGLKGLEVADGADFEPFFLRGAENLEVVGESRSKAHIAAAEPKDAVGQFQGL